MMETNITNPDKNRDDPIIFIFLIMISKCKPYILELSSNLCYFVKLQHFTVIKSYKA